MGAIAAAIAGGAIISGIGSGVSGNQSRQAQQRADDDNAGRLRAQQGQLGAGIYGSSYGAQPYWQTLYQQALEHQNLPAANAAMGHMNDFVNAQGGPVIQQQRQLADSVSGRQTANLAYHDTETSRLAGAAGQAGAGVNNMWSTGGAGINNLASGAEQAARLAGTGRDRIIRRDSATQEHAMNQNSRAQLAASGFANSTAAPAAMAANAATVGQQRENALQSSSDSAQNAFQGARGQRINTAQQLLAGQAGAAERQGQAQIGRDYQRAGDRQTLENQNLTRDIGLRQDPINMLAGTMGGQVMNPYGAVSFAPQAGGSGAALSSVGNSLAAGGVYAGNQQNQQNQMSLLQRLLAGGGG